MSQVKFDPHSKNQGQRSNGSNRRATTDERTDTHTDATKRIISPATQSTNIAASRLDDDDEIKSRLTVSIGGYVL